MRYTHRLKMFAQSHLVEQASRLSCKWVVAISILLLSSSFFAAPAFATATVTAVADLTAGQGILPNSPPTALLRVQITFASGDTVTSIDAEVINAGGLSSGDISRLSIYQDNGDGVFSSADSEVAHQDNPVPGTSYPLSFSDAAFARRADNTWWYFIVVKTSDSIDHADAFQGWLGATNGTPGGTSGTFYGSTSSVVRCECKVVDVFYTQSLHLEDTVYFSPALVLDLWNRYWRPNYLSYSIHTEMTEPNEIDPAGTPHSWYLTELGNYRYSYTTGAPTFAQLSDYTHAYSNLLKFERKRQLLQMQVPTAILGIKVAGKNQFQPTDSGHYDTDYLHTLVIDFTDTDSANFNARDMLYPLNVLDEAQSGVALYRDNNHNGILDEGDTVVDLTNNNSYIGWDGTGNQVTFNFLSGTSAPMVPIPQTYDAESSPDADPTYQVSYLHDRTGTDFLVVIRARPQTPLDSKIEYGADFTAHVTSLTFTSGSNLSSATRNQWYTTKEIKAVLELSDLTGSRADPGSLFPVIGINCVDGPGLVEKIHQITLGIKDETGFDPNIDLAGVYIYQNSTHKGVFDPADSSVEINPIAWTGPTDGWWQTIISDKSGSGFDVPDTDTDTGISVDQGDDYYVVLQTSPNFGYLDKITCRIQDGDIVFNAATTSTTGTGLVTNAQIPPASNERVHWDPFASPETPLTGNVAVKFHDVSSTSITAGSDPAAVLGLELSSNTVSDTQPVLKSLVVQLINTTTGKDNIDMSDLAVMTINSNTSGLGVWKDNGDGVFDAGVDQALTMAAPPTQAISNPAENYQRFLIVLDEAQSVNESFSGHSDYFVTVKTTAGAVGDQFIMRLWGSEMKPPASYGLGFRTTTQSIFPGDTVTTTEAVHYPVSSWTITPTSTITLSSALGGNQSDYEQNWYLVITDGATTAKGKVKKILGVNSGLNTITCESLTGLGTILEIRVFKLDGTSYLNHSIGINFSSGGGGSIGLVTLSGVSNSTAIVLTWVDGTSGNPALGFKIERRDVTTLPYPASWTTIESALTSADTELIVIAANTFQYTDSAGLVLGHTYEYRVTVLDGGAVSNIISVFFSAFKYTPKNLVAISGVQNVTLIWDWPSWYTAFEDGFSIERKGKSEANFTARDILWNVNNFGNKLDNFRTYLDTNFTDTMLATDSTYVYRVRAFKGTGAGRAYSDYSNTDTVEVFSSSVIPGGSGTGGGGGGGAVGPLAVGISALLSWWKRRRKVVRP